MQMKLTSSSNVSVTNPPKAQSPSSNVRSSSNVKGDQIAELLKDVQRISKEIDIPKWYIWTPLCRFLELDVEFPKLERSMQNEFANLLMIGSLPPINWDLLLADSEPRKQLIIRSQEYIRENLWLLQNRALLKK